MTAAHTQVVVLNTRLREWVPEHEPRETDPHYGLFRQAKKKMRELDLPCWRCGVHYKDLVKKGDPATPANPLGAYQLEAHHSDLEFSLLNAVDVGKWWDASTRDDPGFMVESFSRVDGWLDRHPEMRGKPHEEVFMAYMESDGNLLQLCLTPESPVLMGDGASIAIDRVRPGDFVLGPDGYPHEVTGTARRYINGDVVVIDGHRMTPNHPVLTPAGWLPAGLAREGQVLAHLVDVTSEEVVSLRRVEPEVLDAVVRPISVDVMDPFGRSQAAAEMLLHHPAVLGHPDGLAVAPDPSADVAGRMQRRVEQNALLALARGGVQSLHPAIVGAEALHGSVSVLELGGAPLAGGIDGMDALVPRAADGGACSAAGAVAFGDLGSHEELRVADPAPADDTRDARDARWRAVRQVRRERYRGFVHDITVSGYPAFVTGDLVVHNCDVCHRAKGEGIHHIPYPDWRARAVWRADLPAHIQS